MAAISTIWISVLISPAFPLSDDTTAKGAILIYPGGAFQFRSDWPEVTEVAEAMNGL